MTADLEALVVAAYVFADEFPAPVRCGRPALVSDAELVALAVCQAAMGICSDRQFLGLVGYRLPGWFPRLPDQSQYNRRLRALVELIAVGQQRLAGCLDAGGVRLSDGTLIGIATIPVAPSAASSPALPATATPNRSTASSGAYDSSCSATNEVCRSAPHSCPPTRKNTNRSPTCSPVSAATS
jgi:hypothetical protein